MKIKKIVLAALVSTLPLALLPLTSVQADDHKAAESTGYLAATAVNVKDLAASTAFYEKVLGFTVKQTYNTDDMDENIMGAANGKGSSIVLVQYKNKDNSNNGSTRLVFYVTDAKAIVAKAVALGGKIVREPKAFGNTSTIMGIVKDLDGYNVEVIQR